MQWYVYLLILIALLALLAGGAVLRHVTLQKRRNDRKKEV